MRLQLALALLATVLVLATAVPLAEHKVYRRSTSSEESQNLITKLLADLFKENDLNPELPNDSAKDDLDVNEDSHLVDEDEKAVVKRSPEIPDDEPTKCCCKSTSEEVKDLEQYWYNLKHKYGLRRVRRDESGEDGNDNTGEDNSSEEEKNKVKRGRREVVSIEQEEDEAFLLKLLNYLKKQEYMSLQATVSPDDHDSHLKDEGEKAAVTGLPSKSDLEPKPEDFKDLDKYFKKMTSLHRERRDESGEDGNDNTDEDNSSEEEKNKVKRGRREADFSNPNHVICDEIRTSDEIKNEHNYFEYMNTLVKVRRVRRDESGEDGNDNTGEDSSSEEEQNKIKRSRREVGNLWSWDRERKWEISNDITDKEHEKDTVERGQADSSQDFLEQKSSMDFTDLVPIIPPNHQQKRSADPGSSSEEDSSSEETGKGKKVSVAPVEESDKADGIALDNAAEENELAIDDVAHKKDKDRRKRSINDPVGHFSDEIILALSSEHNENLKDEHNENLKDEKSEDSTEADITAKSQDSSVEDYAQGCEVMEANSYEANETTYAEDKRKRRSAGQSLKPVMDDISEFDALRDLSEKAVKDEEDRILYENMLLNLKYIKRPMQRD